MKRINKWAGARARIKLIFRLKSSVVHEAKLSFRLVSRFVPQTKSSVYENLKVGLINDVQSDVNAVVTDMQISL